MRVASSLAARAILTCVLRFDEISANPNQPMKTHSIRAKVSAAAFTAAFLMITASVQAEDLNAVYQQGRSAFYQGDFNTAQQLLSRVAAANPKHPDTVRMLANGFDLQIISHRPEPLWPRGRLFPGAGASPADVSFPTHRVRHANAPGLRSLALAAACVRPCSASRARKKSTKSSTSAMRCGGSCLILSSKA
jgi:hypothetical protein